MGSIFKQNNSKYYWIKYYRHGKPIRETTGSTSHTYAKDLLKKREGNIVHGKSPGTNMEKDIIR